MTNYDANNPEELLPVSEDIESLARNNAESHPFFQREDLETWQRAMVFDPYSGLGPTDERKAMGKALR